MCHANYFSLGGGLRTLACLYYVLECCEHRTQRTAARRRGAPNVGEIIKWMDARGTSHTSVLYQPTREGAKAL